MIFFPFERKFINIREELEIGSKQYEKNKMCLEMNYSKLENFSLLLKVWFFQIFSTKEDKI